MTLRAPAAIQAASAAETQLDALAHEILADKANALGRAGERVEAALAALHMAGDDPEGRARHLKTAAQAVYAYFIQRELCGLRRHDSVIRDYGIPKAVLARLGAC